MAPAEKFYGTSLLFGAPLGPIRWLADQTGNDWATKSLEARASHVRLLAPTLAEVVQAKAVAAQFAR